MCQRVMRIFGLSNRQTDFSYCYSDARPSLSPSAGLTVCRSPSSPLIRLMTSLAVLRRGRSQSTSYMGGIGTFTGSGKTSRKHGFSPKLCPHGSVPCCYTHCPQVRKSQKVDQTALNTLRTRLYSSVWQNSLSAHEERTEIPQVRSPGVFCQNFHGLSSRSSGVHH